MHGLRFGLVGRVAIARSAPNCRRFTKASEPHTFSISDIEALKKFHEPSIGSLSFSDAFLVSQSEILMQSYKRASGGYT